MNHYNKVTHVKPDFDKRFDQFFDFFAPKYQQMIDNTRRNDYDDDDIRETRCTIEENVRINNFYLKIMIYHEEMLMEEMQIDSESKVAWGQLIAWTAAHNVFADKEKTKRYIRYTGVEIFNWKFEEIKEETNNSY